ncbi:hypothetical protein BRADI_2g60251v3 [Brachypodium distachyon]|uniref:Uncharacterized protein n=1 Tax=Brachypodium distachyon TaxID=15368 RepID=A0A0Q3RE18_BRADI|nr:hypothetical protein BRADI_2g60251v3 [Brachypodium distachyon]
MGMRKLNSCTKQALQADHTSAPCKHQLCPQKKKNQLCPAASHWMQRQWFRDISAVQFTTKRLLADGVASLSR